MEQVLKLELLSAILETQLVSLPTPQDLDDAKYEGQTAGTLLLAGGLNPYAKGTQLSRIWNNERLAASARKLSGVR